MTRLFLRLLLVFLPLCSVSAQKVSNVFFRQKGMGIEIRYDLTGVKFYEYCSIQIYATTDGVDYIGPLTLVEGEVGDSIFPGRSKRIFWDVFKEVPVFEGERVGFDVRATVIKQKLERKFYAGYKGSYPAPAGIVIGLTGKTGFYLSGRMNPAYLDDVPYQTKSDVIDGYPTEGYYVFTQKQTYQRLSITAGFSFQLGWKTHWYLGGGFSQYNVLWNIDKYEYPDTRTGEAWVKQTDKSWDKYEIETGLHFNFKYFYFSAGVASPNLKWAEAVLSAGVTF